MEISPVATEENLRYEVAGDVASLYGIGYSRLYSRLRELAGSNSVYTINDGSHSVPVIVGAERADRYGMLQNSIRTNDGVDVPLSTLLRSGAVRTTSISMPLRRGHIILWVWMPTTRLWRA